MNTNRNNVKNGQNIYCLNAEQGNDEQIVARVLVLFWSDSAKVCPICTGTHYMNINFHVVVVVMIMEPDALLCRTTTTNKQKKRNEISDPNSKFNVFCLNANFVVRNYYRDDNSYL